MIVLYNILFSYTILLIFWMDTQEKV